MANFSTVSLGDIQKLGRVTFHDSLNLTGSEISINEFPVTEGDVIRVDPAGARCIKADAQSALRYACIQTRAGSLTQFTQNDGIPSEAKPSWL